MSTISTAAVLAALSQLLLHCSICVVVAQVPPLRFAVDPPHSSFEQSIFNPNIPFNAAPIGTIGNLCTSNVTCTGSNGFCSNSTCKCLPNFILEPISHICQIAPGYNEACAKSGQVLCREPFVCNVSKLCSCAEGFIEEYFQCVKDCAANHVPVNNSCLEAKALGDSCEQSQQCLSAYSECRENVCRCIVGAETEKSEKQCKPVSQCPMGEVATNASGKQMQCSIDNSNDCPSDFYCVQPELTTHPGYCCPKLKMKCPIGEPLTGFNCTNCPWDTHHCFSYTLGSFTDTMCCPNACPATQPIQVDGKCYARSAFGGHCTVTDQCYSVVGSVCREDSADKPVQRCQCPQGPYHNQFGQCIRKSFFNESCHFDRECNGNTRCGTDGRCVCQDGWIRMKDDQICVPYPTCPIPLPTVDFNSTAVLSDLKMCDPEKENSCGDKTRQFCHPWWRELPTSSSSASLVNSSISSSNVNKATKTYAQCCKVPEPKDFESLCEPYHLQLMYEDESDTAHSQPRRCDVQQLPNPFVQNDVNSVTENSTTAMQSCPAGAACLFDPYTVTKGVCCRSPQFATASAGSNITTNSVIVPKSKQPESSVSGESESKKSSANQHSVPLISILPVADKKANLTAS